MRLVNGQHDYEGRVEVYHGEVWGTVCDDGWDVNDATVVCRQLGFSYGAAQSLGSAFFGEGDSQVWLDDVACSGQENRLDECWHRRWGLENCGHGEDAGVSCLKEGLFSLIFFTSLYKTLKDLMPITFSSPRAQPEVIYFLMSNESPYFSKCKSKISSSNSV